MKESLQNLLPAGKDDRMDGIGEQSPLNGTNETISANEVMSENVMGSSTTINSTNGSSNINGRVYSPPPDAKKKHQLKNETEEIESIKERNEVASVNGTKEIVPLGDSIENALAN